MSDTGNTDHTDKYGQVIGCYMTIERFVQAVEHCAGDTSKVSEESYEVGRSVAHLPD
jgi:hypothetical protein